MFLLHSPMEYESFLNRSILLIDGTLTSTTSRPESNGNEGVLHTPKISKNGALPSDAVRSHIQDF